MHEDREAVDRDHARDRLVRAVPVDDVPLHERRTRRTSGRRGTRRSSAPSWSHERAAEQRLPQHDDDRRAEQRDVRARSPASRSRACGSAPSPARGTRSLVAPVGGDRRTFVADRGLLVVAVVLDVVHESLDRSAAPGRAPASGRSRGTARARAAARPCRSRGARSRASSRLSPSGSPVSVRCTAHSM